MILHPSLTLSLSFLLYSTDFLVFLSSLSLSLSHSLSLSLSLTCSVTWSLSSLFYPLFISSLTSVHLYHLFCCLNHFINCHHNISLSTLLPFHYTLPFSMLYWKINQTLLILYVNRHYLTDSRVFRHLRKSQFIVSWNEQYWTNKCWSLP